ncbi:hypothetical protein BDR26DRAFT_865734 [Obelidium mucronatum]|nr:hypothetical protein BDR26DRAFT_865734 [Obelidium mucronatum]
MIPALLLPGILTVVTALPLPVHQQKDNIPNAQLGNETPRKPFQWFAPYIDMITTTGSEQEFSISNWIASSHTPLPPDRISWFMFPGITTLTVDDGVPSFYGSPRGEKVGTGPTPYYRDEINRLSRDGRRIGISFGTVKDGPDFAEGASTTLAEIYDNVLKQLNATWIDIYMSPVLLANQTKVETVGGALAALQSSRKDNREDSLLVTLSFDLDGVTGGLDGTAVESLDLIVGKGVVVDSVVGLMARSVYGSNNTVERRDLAREPGINKMEYLLNPIDVVASSNRMSARNHARAGKKARLGITVVEGISAQTGELMASGYAIHALKTIRNQVKASPRILGVGIVAAVQAVGKLSSTIVSLPFQESDALELSVWAAEHDWVTFLGLWSCNEDRDGSISAAMNMQ